MSIVSNIAWKLMPSKKKLEKLKKLALLSVKDVKFSTDMNLGQSLIWSRSVTTFVLRAA